MEKRPIVHKLVALAVPCLLLAACSQPEPPPPEVFGRESPVGTVPTTAPTDLPSGSVSPTTSTDFPEGTTVVGGCPIMPEAVCVDAQMARSQLSAADMRGADLSGANLSGSDLRRINLADATLQQTNLRNSDLSGADLSGADLEGAKLRYTNVAGADLEGANMKPAQLDQVLLCKTIRPDGRRDDSDCSDTTNTTPSDTGGPSIVTFTMPEEVGCTGTQTSVLVTATWETKKVKSVAFEVDGKPLPADQVFESTGEDSLDFACKKSKHVYTLVATGKDGTEVQRVRTVKRAA